VELFSLLNPVNHARTPAEAERYRVEPYVVAADVYSVAPHVGRGGWSWYTGSAGWMYRLIVESLLGITREGDYLRVDPRLPAAWPGFRFTYRRGAAVYRIAVRAAADGERAHQNLVQVLDDGREHTIELALARIR
jgi:cyclic beta-1,2-glucan synthetase